VRDSTEGTSPQYQIITRLAYVNRITGQWVELVDIKVAAPRARARRCTMRRAAKISDTNCAWRVQHRGRSHSGSKSKSNLGFSHAELPMCAKCKPILRHLWQ